MANITKALKRDMEQFNAQTRCMQCGRYVNAETSVFVLEPDSAFTSEDCGHVCRKCSNAENPLTDQRKEAP